MVIAYPPPLPPITIAFSNPSSMTEEWVYQRFTQDPIVSSLTVPPTPQPVPFKEIPNKAVIRSEDLSEILAADAHLRKFKQKNKAKRKAKRVQKHPWRA